MQERNGRSRQVRCWKLDLANGAIHEFGKYAAPNSFDNDPSYPPTIAITADDETMTKIITSKMDIKAAEVLGLCQLKWGDDKIKKNLTATLEKLNSVPDHFVP